MWNGTYLRLVIPAKAGIQKKTKDTHYFITPHDWTRAISLRHVLSVRHEFGKACQGRGQRHAGFF